jgi:HSP20 family molecular chaperone IbpA
MFPDRDPFDRFDRIRRMFESMPNLSAGDTGRHPTMMSTYVDQSIDENEGVLTVVMDIPGVGKDDIDANVKSHRNRQWLIVEADRETQNTTRQFRQQIALRRRVDPELADSEYNNGVLTVKFPLLDEEDGGVGIEIE